MTTTTHNSNNKLGIWMDHSAAHLIEFTNGSAVTKTIASKFTTDVKKISLNKNENLMHNKEQHQQAEYYNKIGEEIRNYGEVILFGPTNDLAIYGYFANAQNSMYPNELSQIISTTRVTLGLSYALDNILLSGDFRYTKKLQLNSDSLSSSRYEFPLKVRKYFSQYFNVTLEGQYLIETNSSATEYGRLLRLATCYTPSVNLKVKLSATFYHTDSFISRFYQSDVDLPGNSSLFQFFGSGAHYSVVILYNITGGISVAASLAQSVYAYPIGTDLTHKMLVGFQCDARF